MNTVIGALVFKVIATCGAYDLVELSYSFPATQDYDARVESVYQVADKEEQSLSSATHKMSEDLDVWKSNLNEEESIEISRSFQPFSGTVYTYQVQSWGVKGPILECK